MWRCFLSDVVTLTVTVRTLQETRSIRSGCCHIDRYLAEGQLDQMFGSSVQKCLAYGSVRFTVVNGTLKQMAMVTFCSLNFH